MRSRDLPQTRIEARARDTVIGGRYVIDQVIADHPLLTVCRAYDLKELKVVVVELLDETLVQDPALMPRLKEESVRAQSLVHEHIVPFHGLEEDDLHTFGVRDYIDGTSLKDYLAGMDRPVMIYEMMQVIEQAGSALQYAHCRGVLHGAVNPANVLLRFDGRVLLRGFDMPSLAGISSEKDVDPAFLSPEQCCGGTIDHRADIYSLAVVAYTMCAGRPPLVGEGAHVPGKSHWERVCWQHVHEPAPFASKLNPDLPKEISWVLSKALAKKPAERFRSAAEFVAVMRQAAKMAGMDPEAMRVEPAPWRRPPQAIVAPRKSKGVPPPRVGQRKSPLYWLAGLLLLVMSVWVMLLVLALGGSEQQQPAQAFVRSDQTPEYTAEYLAVPTWTPPLIPTPTGTHTWYNVQPSAVSTVPSGSGEVPFNSTRPPTNEFDWFGYVSQVGWRSYTDPRFGFAMVYPEGWSVEQGDNVLRIYMPQRDVGVAVCSCGTRVADAGQWSARVLEIVKQEFPGLVPVQQQAGTPGWLATLALIPHADDDIMLAVLSKGHSQRGYAVVFTAWASDWQGVRPIFDRMARDMRFP